MEKKQSWIRGQCIGKGCFGSVSVAYYKSNGAVFAVKSVDLRSCKANQIAALEKEIRILRSLNSPHVVQYLSDDVSHEQSTQYRNLHMEYLPGGTIADVGSKMDESAVQRYTYCIVSALKYLHSRNIVHCDVKGKNVLITERGEAKLGDLGSAVEIRRGVKMKGSGSPLWMAPEVIRQESQGPESDVWSLGCTIIEMITGKPAWEDKGIHTLLQIASSASIPQIPSSISHNCRDFLTKCFKLDPTQRWNSHQLLHHPFLSSLPTKSLSQLSPRCVLDCFTTHHHRCSDVDMELSDDQDWARDRIGKLATKGGVNWESEEWVLVRGSVKEEEGTSSVYSELLMTDETVEMAGTNSVYLEAVKEESRTELEFENFDGGDKLECGSQKVGVEIFYCGACNVLFMAHIFTILRYTLFCGLMIFFYFCTLSLGLKFSAYHFHTCGTKTNQTKKTKSSFPA